MAADYGGASALLDQSPIRRAVRRAPVTTGPYRYKPYKAVTSPPPGTYDPGLDAQAQAAQRGLQNLGSDTALNNSRAASDYELGKQRIGQTYARTYADAELARARGLENFNTATAGVQRNFQQLGQGQATQEAAAGLQPGDGTGIAAALMRARNQGLAQKPLDTGWVRTQADIGTREQRAVEARDQALGGLGINYQRGLDDRTLALSRAGTENTFYQQDVNKAKLYQATQSGLYMPPVKAPNEHVGVLPGGRKIVFRAAKLGHGMVYVSPDGVVRAGPPGSSAWRIQVDPNTGRRVGAVRGSAYG